MNRNDKTTAEYLREFQLAEALLEASPSTIVVMSPDRKILAFNNEAEKLCGRRIDQVLGKDFLKLFLPPANRASVRADIKKALTGEPTRFDENPILAADGKEHILAWHISRLLDNRNRVAGIAAIGRDITERKRIEADLRNYRDRLEQLVEERTESLKAEVAARRQADEKNRLHYLNHNLVDTLVEIPQAEKPLEEILAEALGIILGASWLAYQDQGAVFLAEGEETLVLKAQQNLAPEVQKSHAHMSIAQFFPGATKPKTPIFSERCGESRRRDEEFHGCYRVPLTSNEHLMGALLLLTDEGKKWDPSTGEFLQLVGGALARLIERYRAGTALKQSEEYWRLLIENSSDIIAVLDGNAVVQYITPSAERILGYSRRDLIGKCVADILGPEQAEQALKLVDKATSLPGVGPPTEIPIRRPDGQTRTVEAIANNLIDDPTVGGIVINGRDVTESRQAQAELEIKRHELILHNKITTDFLNVLEITSGSLNFSEALNKLLPLVSALTQSDFCLVFFVDINKREIYPSHHWGLSPEGLGRFLSFKESFSGLDRRAPSLPSEITYISDLDEPATDANRGLQALLKSLKTGSSMIMPIAYEGRTEAIIAACRLKSVTWTKKHREIAGKLRKHLEAFYTSYKHTAELLNKTISLRQRLEMIEAMTGIDRAILSSTSKEQVAFGAIQLLGKVVTGDIIEILEFDSANDIFALAASSESGTTDFSPRDRFAQSDMKSWTSLRFGSPAYFADFDQEPVFEKYERRFVAGQYKSLLIVPLMSHGDLLGALAVGNKMPAAFTAEQVDVAKRLGDQIAVALSNTGLIERLREALVGTVNSLVVALDAKSPWTQGHSERVSDYAVKTGEALGLNEGQLYDLRLAALFHDVGKIGTYDVVLDKKAKLNHKEVALLKKHPDKTHAILAPVPGLERIAVIAKYHHEKRNGTGYPDGLAGEDIPLMSRIISLADSYDGMTSDRPYRKALSPDEALAEIGRCAGVQFDPEIAHVFVDATAKELRSAGEGEGKQAA